MFQMEIDGETFAMKPMNCPGHCLVFGARERSHKELPLRMAEFGILHRNEASGALSGLTRVRRLVQDDAHIFCAPEQVDVPRQYSYLSKTNFTDRGRVFSVIDFLQTVYHAFGFTYKVGLSTRNPQKFIGELDIWDKAEAQLSRVLERVFPGQWKLKEGDSAVRYAAIYASENRKLMINFF
jgi:threonyl-tRNA synthetase